MRGLLTICATIYLSGVVLYSALFIFSSNQDPLVQTAKIFVAATHCLLLIIPVMLAQSRALPARVLGHGLIAAYFVYAIFLVGYFPYFGFVPEIYAFDSGSLRDLGEVTFHYFRQLFGWRELTLIALFALLLWQIRRHPLPRFGWTMSLLPVALLGYSLHAFGPPANSEQFGNVTVLRRFGPVAFSYASLSEWVSFRGGFLAQDTPHPGKVANLIHDDTRPTRAFTSEIPRVDRVIIVQIESFDSMAIDAQLSGQPVMPFVANLRERCLNYSNFYTMKGAGGSSDAEFSVATGLVPSARLASLKHMEFGAVETLYDRLAAHGIRASFAHNNQSGFYGRNRAYAQIKGLETQFMKPNEPVAEADFANAALDDALRASDRMLHYFFNFQSHGPYQGYSDATGEKFAITRGRDIHADYLATLSEVDQMVAGLFNRQAAGFEAGRNLFVLLSDHPSYLHVTDELDRHRVPAMICHRDLRGADIANVFGSIDLHATILHAFGLDSDGPSLGQSMFLDAPNAVLLPQRQIVFRDPSGDPLLIPCGAECDAFFEYTEQHIRF